jgi:adenosine deaminase
MSRELSDLHIHVGGAVAPHILWSIAHDQGFKLPVSDYWEFRELISARPGKVKSLDEYLAVLHQWTEKIQSSPQALERSVYEIIGKEYRSSRVSLIELRFNPMKRNVGGERDLDHIIHAALRGMDRAVLEYGVRAGLIFCLAREFEPRLNEIIVDKAIRYRRRGVVGIDLAGTERHAVELMPAEVARYREMYARARAAGLKTTVHTGETARTGPEGVRAVLEQLEPHRIGHGICAAQDEQVMAMLRERGVTPVVEPRHAVGGVARGAGRDPAALLAGWGALHDQHRRPVPARHEHAARDRPAPRRAPARERAGGAGAALGGGGDLRGGDAVTARRLAAPPQRAATSFSASSSAAAVRARSSADRNGRGWNAPAAGVPQSSRGASTPGK